MGTSIGERICVLLLTLITLGSVMALTFLFFAATPNATPAEAQLRQ